MKKVVLLGGKERELRFGIGFLGAFLEETNLEISQIDEKLKQNPFTYVPKMMFDSLKFAEKRKGNEIDFTESDVIDWVDEAGGLESEPVKSFFLGFAESMQTKLPEVKGKQNQPKK